MENTPTLVRRVRAAAGLSARALAGRAGVSASTITRIESGRMDPTVGMLQRILAAAGQDLHVSTRLIPRRRHPALAGLLDAWAPSPAGDCPDWTRLRAFLDHLALHPELIQAAIVRPPAPSGSPLMDVLLAGIADKVADDAGLARPAWTRGAGKLDELWLTPGTPRMQARARRQAPPQLLARGLAIDASSLWRDRESVGV